MTLLALSVPRTRRVRISRPSSQRKVAASAAIAMPVTVAVGSQCDGSGITSTEVES